MADDGTRERKNGKDFLFISIFVLGVIVLRLFYIARTKGPFIYADELGYWSHAAHMTGNTWAGVMDGVSWYSFGYSFWLALTFFLSNQMTTMYHIAILMNLCMGLLESALVYRIIKRYLPEYGTFVCGFCAFAVTSYPSYIFYSYTTLSETLYALIVWLLFYELILLEEHPAWGRAVALGCTASYGFMVHNRMLSIVGAVAVCLAILLITHKIGWKHILYIAISAGACLMLYFIIKERLSLAIVNNQVVESTGSVVAQGSYNTFAFVFRKFLRVFQWNSIKNVLINVMGQIWECLSSSYLLAGLGIVYCLKRIWDKGKEKNKCLYTYPLTCMVCSVGMTGIAAYGRNLPQVGDRVRMDPAFLGRYNAPLIPLFIMAACVMFLKKNYDLAWKGYAGTVVVYLAVSVGVFIRLRGIENGYLNIVSAVAIHIFHWLGEFSVLKCVAIALAGSIMFMGLGCITFKWKQYWNYCAIFLMMVFLFSTTALYCMRTSIRGENDYTARYTPMFEYLTDNTQKGDIVYICQDGKMSYDLQTRLPDKCVVCTIPERLEDVQAGTYVVIGAEQLDTEVKQEYELCFENEEYVVIRMV